jgi:hypothetical protein
MTNITVNRYVAVTEERYERDGWRSAYFVCVDDQDPAAALFREGDGSPSFDTPSAAASAALRRGVEFASSLRDPKLIGLLKLYS